MFSISRSTGYSEAGLDDKQQIQITNKPRSLHVLKFPARLGTLKQASRVFPRYL